MGTFGVFVCVLAWRKWMRSKTPYIGPAVEHRERYLQAFAICVALQDLAPMIPSLLPASARGGARQVVNAGWYIGPVLAFAWPRFRGTRWRALLADLGMHSGTGLRRELLVGLAGGCVVYCLVVVTFVGMVQIAGLTSLASGPPIWPGTFRFVLFRLLWAPVVEEVLYRGILIRGLGQSLPWWASAVTAATVFALAHDGSEKWPALLVAGFVFGVLRHWRGSLISAVAAHAVVNTVQLVLLLWLHN